MNLLSVVWLGGLIGNTTKPIIGNNMNKLMGVCVSLCVLEEIKVEVFLRDKSGGEGNRALDLLSIIWLYLVTGTPRHMVHIITNAMINIDGQDCITWLSEDDSIWWVRVGVGVLSLWYRYLLFPVLSFLSFVLLPTLFTNSKWCMNTKLCILHCCQIFGHCYH